MGRKAKFDEKTEKKGLSHKKKKKFQEPTFSEDKTEPAKLSHRQKQRAKKRLMKKELKTKIKEDKILKSNKKPENFEESDFDVKKLTNVLPNKKRQLKNSENALQPKLKKLKKVDKKIPKLQLFDEKKIKKPLNLEEKKLKSKDNSNFPNVCNDETQELKNLKAKKVPKNKVLMSNKIKFDNKKKDQSRIKKKLADFKEINENNSTEEKTDESLDDCTSQEDSDSEADSKSYNDAPEDESEESDEDHDYTNDEDCDNEENSEEDDDLLPIEKANKKLKKKEEKERKLAEAELSESMSHHQIFNFPTEEELNNPTSLQDVQDRIKSVLGVLSNFKKYRQSDRSRSEYTELLNKDLCTYFSYNSFLMSRLMEIFPLSELLQFLEASEIQRPMTIRTNTLVTRRRDLAQSLISKGVNLDPLDKWTNVGLVVYSSQVPMGATTEYLTGQYIIQGASSFLPVMALDPKPNERILDMCAAPGGKSSYVAALMKNTGVLMVNDANKERIKAAVGNIHRMKISNTVISTYDGRKIPAAFKGFNRVLLDAPCTGTGVVAKDPSVKINKDEIDVQRCCTLQRELLLKAIDLVRTNGVVVYSTCSILPEENEQVVDYALKKRNVKIVETGLKFGAEGFVNFRHHRFHPTMKNSRRYYPHEHNMDGFFVAKLVKFSDIVPKAKDIEEESTKVEN